MGGITEIATSAPGYNSIRPNTCAPLAETLKLNGYSTAHFGKCHEVPVWKTSPGRPVRRWPTGGGRFEYFYGFVAGEIDRLSDTRPSVQQENAATCRGSTCPPSSRNVQTSDNKPQNGSPAKFGTKRSTARRQPCCQPGSLLDSSAQTSSQPSSLGRRRQHTWGTDPDSGESEELTLDVRLMTRNA